MELLPQWFDQAASQPTKMTSERIKKNNNRSSEAAA